MQIVSFLMRRLICCVNDPKAMIKVCLITGPTSFQKTVSNVHERQMHDHPSLKEMQTNENCA